MDRDGGLGVWGGGVGRGGVRIRVSTLESTPDGDGGLGGGGAQGANYTEFRRVVESGRRWETAEEKSLPSVFRGVHTSRAVDAAVGGRSSTSRK